MKAVSQNLRRSVRSLRRRREFGAVALLALVTVVSGCGTGRPMYPDDVAPIAGSGGSFPAASQADETVLAVVGDHAITAGELRHRILVRFYGNRALEGLIKERLFRDEATRLGLEVTEREVSTRVDQEIDAMLREVGGQRQTLAKALEEQGTSLEERRRELYHEYRNLLLIERVVLAQRRQWGVTEKALRDRYAETYQRTSVRVRHIAFPVVEPETPEQADAALAAAQNAARSIHAQIRGGGDFAQLAREHSGDPVTAREGGLLGWVNREALPDTDLADAIFRLPVGVASEPVLQERYGYHIFLVEERREAQPFESVRGRLEKEILEGPPTTREIQSISQKLRGQAVTILADPVL